jgi:hypothetical protein
VAPAGVRRRRSAGTGHNRGLQELALPGPGWSTLDRGTAELIDFVRPRDLER